MIVRWWERVLLFFNVYDPESRALSLTNLAMWLVLAKLSVAQKPSIADLTAFFIACLARGHSKEVELRNGK